MAIVESLTWPGRSRICSSMPSPEGQPSLAVRMARPELPPREIVYSGQREVGVLFVGAEVVRPLCEVGMKSPASTVQVPLLLLTNQPSGRCRWTARCRAALRRRRPSQGRFAPRHGQCQPKAAARVEGHFARLAAVDDHRQRAARSCGFGRVHRGRRRIDLRRRQAPGPRRAPRRNPRLRPA